MLGARLDEVYPVVPIAEDQAPSIGMLRNHRHMHFGPYADAAALPDAARLPDLLADEVRALADARPAQHAHRPVVAVRARPAPTPS
jgi:hypothetical protein